MKITFSELLMNWALTLVILLTLPLNAYMASRGLGATSQVFIVLFYLCGVLFSFTLCRNKYRQETSFSAAIWLSVFWFVVTVITTISATRFYLYPVSTTQQIQ